MTSGLVSCWCPKTSWSSYRTFTFHQETEESLKSSELEMTLKHKGVKDPHMVTTYSRNVLSRDTRVIMEVTVIKLTPFFVPGEHVTHLHYFGRHSTSWVAIYVSSVIVCSSE